MGPGSPGSGGFSLLRGLRAHVGLGEEGPAGGLMGEGEGGAQPPTGVSLPCPLSLPPSLRRVWQGPGRGVDTGRWTCTLAGITGQWQVAGDPRPLAQGTGHRVPSGLTPGSAVRGPGATASGAGRRAGCRRSLVLCPVDAAAAEWAWPPASHVIVKDRLSPPPGTEGLGRAGQGRAGRPFFLCSASP